MPKRNRSSTVPPGAYYENGELHDVKTAKKVLFSCHVCTINRETLLPGGQLNHRDAVRFMDASYKKRQAHGTLGILDDRFTVVRNSKNAKLPFRPWLGYKEITDFQISASKPEFFVLSVDSALGNKLYYEVYKCKSREDVRKIEGYVRQARANKEFTISGNEGDTNRPEDIQQRQRSMLDLPSSQDSLDEPINDASIYHPVSAPPRPTSDEYSSRERPNTYIEPVSVDYGRNLYAQPPSRVSPIDFSVSAVNQNMDNRHYDDMYANRPKIDSKMYDDYYPRSKSQTPFTWGGGNRDSQMPEEMYVKKSRSASHIQFGQASYIEPNNRYSAVHAAVSPMPRLAYAQYSPEIQPSSYLNTQYAVQVDYSPKVYAQVPQRMSQVDYTLPAVVPEVDGNNYYDEVYGSRLKDAVAVSEAYISRPKSDTSFIMTAVNSYIQMPEEANIRRSQSIGNLQGSHDSSIDYDNNHDAMYHTSSAPPRPNFTEYRTSAQRNTYRNTQYPIQVKYTQVYQQATNRLAMLDYTIASGLDDITYIKVHPMRGAEVVEYGPVYMYSATHSNTNSSIY